MTLHKPLGYRFRISGLGLRVHTPYSWGVGNAMSKIRLCLPLLFPQKGLLLLLEVNGGLLQFAKIRIMIFTPCRLC